MAKLFVVIDGAPVPVSGGNGGAGTGLPAGGTTGQVLTKASDADGDTDWEDASGGGGSFDVASLPDATVATGKTIYVPDGDDGNPCGAMSDGTSWLRFLLGLPVSSGPFTPAALPGLGLWLNASTYSGSDGDAVSSWPDGSGNGNAALQPGGGSAAPTFETNELNGLPIMRIGSGSAFMTVADAVSLRPDTGLTVSIVVKVGSLDTTDFCGLFDKIASSVGYGIGFNSGGNRDKPVTVIGVHSAISSVGIDDAAWHIVTGWVDATTAKIYVDATETGSTSATLSDGIGTTDAVFLGDAASSNRPPNGGDIAEIVMCNVALSPTELDALHGYYQTKYAL